MSIDTWLQESTIYDGFVKAVDAIGLFIFEWPELVVFEAGGLALVIAMFWWNNRKKAPQGEHDEMKRRTQLESLYADKVHDFMLDMLTKGEINRKEYKRDCKRFGVAFRLLDLLRSPRSKIGIKHRVLGNIRKSHATLPFIQPPPGPKPGEVVTLPVKATRKVWIAEVKRRSAS